MVDVEGLRRAREAVEANIRPAKVYRPHPGQLLVHQAQKDLRIINAGRSWGKSALCIGEALGTCGVIKVPGVSAYKNALVIFVEPTYKQSPTIWDELDAFIPQALKERCPTFSKHTHEIMFPPEYNNARIRIRSADRPEGLRGPHPDLWILDEFAQYKPSVFGIIAPATVTVGHRNRMLIPTTPFSKNHFYRLVKDAEQHPDDSAYFHYTSYDSPYVIASKMQAEEDRLRRLGGEQLVRQEIYAEFIDDTGGVFEGLRKCIKPGPTPPPLAAHFHGIGWDYAERRDFTAVVALDPLKHIRKVERWQGPLSIQLGRIEAFLKEAAGTVVLDETGVGQEVIQRAHERGIKVAGFTMTQASKAAIVQALASEIAAGNITIYDDQVDLIDELEIFTYTLTRMNQIRYEAPEGEHDDLVVALALANYVLDAGPKGFEKGFIGAAVVRKTTERPDVFIPPTFKMK